MSIQASPLHTELNQISYKMGTILCDKGIIKIKWTFHLLSVALGFWLPSGGLKHSWHHAERALEVKFHLVFELDAFIPFWNLMSTSKEMNDQLHHQCSGPHNHRTGNEQIQGSDMLSRQSGNFVGSNWIPNLPPSTMSIHTICVIYLLPLYILQLKLIGLIQPPIMTTFHWSCGSWIPEAT